MNLTSAHHPRPLNSTPQGDIWTQLARSLPTAEDDVEDTTLTPTRHPIVRRSSRLARARSSFTTTIPAIFSRSLTSSRAREALASPPPYPIAASTDEQPPANTSDPQPPAAEIVDQVVPHNISAETNPTQTASRRRSAFGHARLPLLPDRTFPRLTASLRRRRSPSDREDHAAMLSRLLSVAATATAASLMGGNPETAVTDLRNATSTAHGDDGTFDGFLQALRNGHLASAMGRSAPVRENNGDDAGTTQGVASLDFFRMFRFGSDAGERATAASTRPNAPSEARRAPHNRAPDDGTTEQRMVPVLIVGIRSLNSDVVNSSSGASIASADNGEIVPSFLDALTNFPTTINIGLESGVNETLQEPQESQPATRVRQRRRASMGGFNLFSNVSRDSVRRQSSMRPSSEVRPSATYETPAGPFPPPTTPASPPFSAPTSGDSTPMTRTDPRIPNALHRQSQDRQHDATDSPDMRGDQAEIGAVGSDGEAHFPRSPRQRRRMSEGADLLGFGPSSSRRNGMHLDADDASDAAPRGPNEASRSWIIYVLGGSYPENHPILTTPSLFTDSPTYEDMLLLSSLLGPAKPPVAAAEDVARASGLYRVVRNGEGPDGKVARAIPDVGEFTGLCTGDCIAMPQGERCHVCLCDYSLGEEARKLKQCGHFFHRECIDQVRESLSAALRF